VRLEAFLRYLADEPGWADLEAVGVLSRAVSGDTPLHAALWADDDEAAQALVEAGADVNMPGEEGYSPLHVAVAQGNVTMARYLATRGASWDSPNEFGLTARQNALASEDAAVRGLVMSLGE
jgi:ankyrin repeat protein